MEFDVKNLIDEETDKIFYPATHQEAVFDDDGKMLKDVIGTENIGSVGDGTIKGAIKKMFSDLTGHISSKENPHKVNKSQVGLSNVPNVTTNDQTPTYSASATNENLVSGEKLSVAFGKIARAITSLISHIANKSNPHGVSKSQVGLGNCNNTADAEKSVKYATSAGSAGTATKINDGAYEWTPLTLRTWLNDRYTKSEADDKYLYGKSGQYDLKGGNLMRCKRVQSVDDNPLFLAAGDGDNSNTYVHLLGSSAKVTNTNNTSYVPMYAASFTNPSSKLVKENITEISEEEIKKVLDVDWVKFDYIKEYGGEKNQTGAIAEQLLDLIPSCVNVPENYDEKNFDKKKGVENDILTVDYSKIVPYLGGMIKLQQKQIEDLTKRLEKMEKISEIRRGKGKEGDI